MACLSPPHPRKISPKLEIFNFPTCEVLFSNWVNYPPFNKWCFPFKQGLWESMFLSSCRMLIFECDFHPQRNGDFPNQYGSFPRILPGKTWSFNLANSSQHPLSWDWFLFIWKRYCKTWMEIVLSNGASMLGIFKANNWFAVVGSFKTLLLLALRPCQN